MIARLKDLFLWAGFFIRTGRLDGYKKWKAEVKFRKDQAIAPNDSVWFYPLLRKWIDYRFLKRTGLKPDFVAKAYEQLCYEPLVDFAKVKNVGLVKTAGDTIFVKVPADGKHPPYWFTINESAPGEIYVHEMFITDETKLNELTDWKLAYRRGWEINSLHFMPYLKELWRQIKSHEKRD